MRLELLKLFETTGECKNIQYELDLSDCEIFGVKPFLKPTKVNGFVDNRADVVRLSITVDFITIFNCDRCLNEFTKNHSFSFEYVLVRKTDSQDIPDDFIVVSDNSLDLDELVTSEIFLYLPAKILCSDNCKGLCQTCGKNLNEGLCDCNNATIDPRLEKLKDFLV